MIIIMIRLQNTATALALACALAIRSVLTISIRKFSNRGSRIPEPLLVFTSKCPLKIQVSQGLGPFFQIEVSLPFPSWGLAFCLPSLLSQSHVQVCVVCCPQAWPTGDSHKYENRPYLQDGSGRCESPAETVRGWRNTVAIVQLEISNWMKPYPSAFHACAFRSRPATGLSEPNKHRRGFQPYSRGCLLLVVCHIIV